MASFVNRSISVNPKPSPVINGTALDSPLKIFVLAKKKINEIFLNINEYVLESENFLANQRPCEEVVSDEQVSLVGSYGEIITGIRDVLKRDHMKVAFFGRTSNGKSTVINSVLQNKILPAGIGHTTNCFLQVEGTDEEEPYMTVENAPHEKLNVESVLHLANALNTENLGDSTLVRIFWPKSKCALLHDDVVLMDSPGIDVSANLDDWIDKHCLDADVFVLVSNAESTLMRAEKNFFHHVNEKLSKPNIFILNNRWDASANEPENLELVRKQHMTRDVDFLCNELNVANRNEAEDRVFFVSAKEVLQLRLQQQKGIPLEQNVLPDGYQSRYFEFENFERKFEECLSKSAVKTKFDQHTKRGKKLINELTKTLESIYSKSSQLKLSKLAERKEKWDKVEFLQQQMSMLTSEVKHQICHMVEQVEVKVSAALNEEIRRLSLLVNDFERPFAGNPLVVSVYKKELHTHVERGLGSNLRARLSTALSCNVESAQKEMIERVSVLLPPNEQHKQFTYSITPRHNFEILYRINCESLCSDFCEDLEFRFSFGLVNLMKRFAGGKTYLKDNNASKSLPSTAPQTPSNSESKELVPAGVPSAEMLTIIEKFALVSPHSQTTIGVLAVGGFLVRSIGWRIIAITAGIYGLLYAYERLTWTNKAKERTFKKQYVNHATRKLKLIVDLTSANCSHQVQQELSATYARLCHMVDEIVSDMQVELKALDEEIERLDSCASDAKLLRNKASYISSELEKFSEQFLSYAG